MVGYSRMMSTNDSRTVEAVRMLREIIDSRTQDHRGRVFGIAGDGFVMEYPDPVAGVECALKIQEQLRKRNKHLSENDQVWLRIGLDIGEAIDDNGDLHGDCVNIAVRLQEAAPTGGILVSQGVQLVTYKIVDLEFRSLGELIFKNIENPIEVFDVHKPGDQVSGTMHSPPVLEQEIPIPGFNNRHAIAVLPFSNLAKDPEIDHICEGASDELILLLSHWRQFPVIDRNSSCIYRSDAVEARKIGSELGARYLLYGTISHRGNSLCLVVRLVDTEAAHTVWSDKYELERTRIFEALDETILRIAGAIETQISNTEAAMARTKRKSRIENTDLLWRSRWHLNRLTKSDSAEAHSLLLQALQIEPDMPEGLIQLGYWHWMKAWAQRDSQLELSGMRDIAYKAKDANPFDARGHFLAGSVEILLRELDIAVIHFQKAIELNPSMAHAYAQLGSCHMLSGRPSEAITSLEMALRLNPIDYYVFYVLGEIAACHCMLGNWDIAINFSRKSMALKPFYWHARMTEINAYARSGNLRDAARSLDALCAHRSDFSREYVEWLPFQDSQWIQYFYAGIEMVEQYTRQLSPAEANEIEQA